MEDKAIVVRGARVNNLKNVSLDIPRDRLVVVTGLSGSGKSSLAFDTLYAEGQRRYVESLSAYARQFLGRMHKPECDFIHGLPPAIAIEQKVTTRNPRSTVGTSTEIYDYLRMLFARVGRTFSPVSGQEVRRHTVADVVDCIARYAEGTRLLLLAPLRRGGKTFGEALRAAAAEGFARVAKGTEMCRIDQLAERLDASGEAADADEWLLVVDRLVAGNSPEARGRLADSAETAFYEGDGRCYVRVLPSGVTHEFSTRFEADGLTFREPDDLMFSFNSPAGACPECEGFGRVVGIDESLVVPDTSLSVYEGAVVCWRGEKMGLWREEFCRRAEKSGFPIFQPYYKLTEAQKNVLWHGDAAERQRPRSEQVSIDAFFDMVRENQYKIQYRVMLARYRGKTLCPACRGSRLRPEADYVKVGGRCLSEIVRMPVDAAAKWFESLELGETDARVARRLLDEIRSRLGFLQEVGLGYLTLDRLSSSLSGGESQRINLATSIGSSLVGSLYILDEPSIGLHPRDTKRLIGVLCRLRDAGNTVVVVEHDEEIMRSADHLVDIGPEAGREGGEVVYEGAPPAAGAAVEAGRSHTLAYLSGRERIEVPASRRPWNRSLRLTGCRGNNLQGFDVEFPLNVLTVVTGVSGSGKSTLVRDILYRALKRNLDEAADRPAEYRTLEGDVDAVGAVEFVDQNPIGRSSRSNPVTYVKAYDEIRRLMADQPLAQQMELTPAHFSFNADGGRCETCKGEGRVKIPMQFMADLELECDDCHGLRFKRDVLEVRYEGKNVHDLLEMTVDAALQFFADHGQRRIVRRLQPLADVGLGYIRLGQSSATLSGGENQRVKLAYYLSQEKSAPTLFIFDEPTTGLHPRDIGRLLRSLDALIDRGHTVLVIEHNPDVMKCADPIIDLGPEGGSAGGQVVAVGTPEEIVRRGRGHTARFLAEKLGRKGGK